MSSLNPEFNMLEKIPCEILLLILEWLLRIDPVTLLGVVPCLCKQMRSLCPRVHGTFDMTTYGIRDVKAMSMKISLFPWTKGLWSFTRFPLHKACRNGLLLVVESLLKEDKNSVDEKDLRRETPLCISCGNGDLDVVRMLFRYGACIDEEGRGDKTPLYIACENGDVDVARFLLENGAIVDKSICGHTPILRACQEGFLDIVRLLLEYRADHNIMDLLARETPLSVARKKGHKDIESLLKQAGATR